MDRLETIRSVIELATAERSTPSDGLDHVRAVRERLEDAIGGSVRASEAARMLGVSPPSLKRWLDSGEVPTVVTPSGRREIPVGELVDLVIQVEEERRRGRERALSAVIRQRREQAASLDVRDLLPPRRGRTHRQVELQSLAYHRLVAKRLTPRLVAEARRRVDRWEKNGRLASHWAAEWRRLLSRPLDEIRRTIGKDSIAARELRQTSPFVGTVTEQERRRIIDAVEARR